VKKPARTSSRKKYRSVALTIAGSDPGGGAGIQADLKTFAALGVYGYSVITAVIAQNSSTVNRVAPVEAAMVAAQIETLVAERLPDAIKTGALGTAKIVEAVADAIIRLDLPAPVVDPVLISSAGARLLDPAGERALLKRLLLLARIVTPNLAEAQALSGVDGESPAAIRAMARALGKAGARAVLIKGGHASGPESVDLLVEAGRCLRLAAPRVATKNTHGTGCKLASALAAGLAKGLSLDEAARQAKSYVSAALAAADRLAIGAGRGPLHHFHAWW